MWLFGCVILGLLLAPEFDAMPARMKFLGLHAWALAGCIGAGCTWAAVKQGIRSRPLVGGVSVLITWGALLIQAHWGYAALKRATAERMPLLPLPQQVGSPEQLAQSMQMQRVLEQVLVPTFTDYQRRRMNSPGLRRIHPLVLWGAEMFIAALVCVMVSRQTYRQMTTRDVSDSLTMPPTTP